MALGPPKPREVTSPCRPSHLDDPHAVLQGDKASSSRSPTPCTVESDATYQRKLRQQQLQRQFREQMEKQPYVQMPAPAVEKKSEAELPAPPLTHSTPVTADPVPLKEKVVLAENIEDNLEMWDLTPDLEDIPILNNQIVTQDRTPHSLLPQKLQEKSGLWHPQTHSTNQHVTGDCESRRKSQDMKKRKLDPS